MKGVLLWVATLLSVFTTFVRALNIGYVPELYLLSCIAYVIMCVYERHCIECFLLGHGSCWSVSMVKVNPCYVVSFQSQDQWLLGWRWARLHLAFLRILYQETHSPEQLQHEVGHHPHHALMHDNHFSTIKTPD